VLDVSERDLVAYRTVRLDAGISQRLWARQLVVVRALFTFLFETGRRDSLPWIQVGSRSVVTSRIPHTEMDVRALSRAQWIALRDVGFGGERPGGSITDGRPATVGPIKTAGTITLINRSRQLPRSARHH
jgi:hypothetical protein